MNFLLVSIALIPGASIALFYWWIRPKSNAPIRFYLSCYGLGVLCTILPLLMQRYAAHLGWDRPLDSSLLNAIRAFGIIGLSEELGKFLVLYLFAWNRNYMRFPLDMMVAAVFVGMGFATLENINYTFREGMETGLYRMFLAVPAHATYAILMGYYVGLAKVLPRHKRFLFFTGLFWSILLHGGYNYFIFQQQVYVTIIVLLVGIVLSINLTRRAIDIGQRLNASS
jgi:RsiW-degrading membrane proteinase PrsW (M82 family)